MKRFEERKTDLINATNRLKEALEKDDDDVYDEKESRKIYKDIKSKYIFEIEKLVKFIEYK